MDQNVKLDRRVMWGLTFVTLLVAVAVAFYNPGLLSFRAFSAAEFVGQMLPLLMVALFIERVLEVFLTSWRAQRSGQLEERAEHRGQTRRIAFLAGTTLGAVLGGGSDALHQMVLVFTNFLRSAHARFSMRDRGSTACAGSSRPGATSGR